MRYFFKHNKQNIERVVFLADSEFKIRFYQNKLGLLWALFNPLSQVLIYYFAFTYLIRVDIKDFVFYLFFGIIISTYFNQNSGGNISFLKEKKILYENTNMNKLELYFSSLLSGLIGFFFNFIVAYLCYVLFSEEFIIGSNVLLLPLFILLLYLSSFVFSLILSNLYVLFRDIDQIWSVVSIALFWTAPIIFKGDFIVEKFPYILYFHPYAFLVQFFRDIIMYDTTPNFYTLGIYTLVLFIYLLIGLWFLKKIGRLASEKFQI